MKSKIIDDIAFFDIIMECGIKEVTKWQRENLYAYITRT